MSIVAISLSHVRNEDFTYVKLLQSEGFTIKLLGDDHFSFGRASDREQIDRLQGVSAVIAAAERYNQEVITSLPSLRVISRFGVGFDSVDVGSATENNVVVTITPNSNYEAVAEHAIALIMAVAKSIVITTNEMRRGGWPTQPLLPVRGTSLGIVGLGRIGRSLAIRARAMKMEVNAFEPKPDLEFVREYDIGLMELDNLLKVSDYVSLNCALSEETRGMIDSRKLALMKPESVLINTARGGLVVEKDLIQALKSGRIAGAGLDVFEIEPTDQKNPLYSMENVVVSSHLAGNDKLSVEDMGNEAAQNIIDLFNGNWPDTAVINNQLKGKWIW